MTNDLSCILKYIYDKYMYLRMQDSCRNKKYISRTNLYGRGPWKYKLRGPKKIVWRRDITAVIKKEMNTNISLHKEIKCILTLAMKMRFTPSWAIDYYDLDELDPVGLKKIFDLGIKLSNIKAFL